MDGRSLRAPAGSALLYPANHRHQERSAETPPLETYFISFHWDALPSDLPLWAPDAQGRIRMLAAWIYQEREAYFAGTQSFFNALLRALLAEYVRLCRHQGNEMVERVRAYIHAHLDEEIALSALAERAGASKYHFIRSYRAHTGMTPMQDLRRIRLETARHLLLTTRLPLKAIAPRVGFASEYHLSRLLKQRLSLGARELRRRA